MGKHGVSGGSRGKRVAALEKDPHLFERARSVAKTHARTHAGPGECLIEPRGAENGKRTCQRLCGTLCTRAACRGVRASWLPCLLRSTRLANVTAGRRSPRRRRRQLQQKRRRRGPEVQMLQPQRRRVLLLLAPLLPLREDLLLQRRQRDGCELSRHR